MGRTFVVPGHRPFRFGMAGARDGVDGRLVFDLMPGALVFEAWLSGLDANGLVKRGLLVEGPTVDGVVPEVPDMEPFAFQPDDVDALAPASDDDGDENAVPDGTVDEVLAWVGDSPERAAEALAVENAREKPRKGIVDALTPASE